MKTSVAGGLIVLGSLAFASADDAQTRVARAIETVARTQEEILAVPLDSDVYAVSQGSLADLRVLDDEGREVEYIVRQAPGTKTRLVQRHWTARDPALRPLEEGGLEITLTLDKDDPRPDGLRLVTPLDNFEQHLRVESSPDGSMWRPLAEALLFDYSRYMDVRSDSVDLPQTPHRHFRLLVERVTAEQESELLELTRRLQGDQESNRTERVQVERRPFRIDRVAFWAEQAEEKSYVPREVDYPLAKFEVSPGEEGETVIDIETRRQPLTAVTIETPDRNFSRRAALYAIEEHGPRRERLLSEGTLTRFGFRSLSREELTIEFPETRVRELRLKVENRDSEPLEVTGVKAAGPVHEVVFLAAPGTSYRLAFGGDVQAPAYDTAAINAALGEVASPLAGKLGEAAAPLAVPADASRSAARWLNDPWLLTGLIVVLVAALGWGLYQAARRVDQLPPGDDAA